MHPFYPSQSFESTDISHTLIALENAHMPSEKNLCARTHIKKKKISDQKNILLLITSFTQMTT